LSENPRTLLSEATSVLADCEAFLEKAAQTVLTIPKKREKALEDAASAEERLKRTTEEFRRAWRNDPGSLSVERAEKEQIRASREVSRAHGYLASNNLDSEYQKAVARQVAGLLRDDSLEKLDEIAARSDDPKLHRTVAECKEGVRRATSGVINRFPAHTPLLQDEVRKARIEARETLERLKNPPVG
jgi:hypothetical protein